MTTHIYYLRHGQTPLNASHKTRGSIDIDLDTIGVKQAKQAGLKIKKEGGVDIIFSSPKKRTMHTAEIVGKELGVTKIVKEPDMSSLDYGELDGQPSELVDKIALEFIKHEPMKPIGNTGDSFQNFKKRVLDSFLEIVNKNKNKRILIVGSSSGNRLLNAWIKAGAKTTYEIDVDTWAKPNLENGEYIHWYGIWSKDVGLL